MAAGNGKSEVITLFLDRNVPIDTPNQNGQTALHLAAEQGQTNALTILLGGGSDKEIQNYRGKTAYDAASSQIHPDLKSRVKPEGHVQALLDAAKNGDAETLTGLLDRGINTNYSGQYGAALGSTGAVARSHTTSFTYGDESEGHTQGFGFR